MKTERSILLTDSGLHALKNNPLTKAENMILWHLVSTLPIAGNVVSKAALEQELSITRAQLSNVIKRFCEIGFIVRGARIGISYHYKLNPLFFRILS